MSDDLNEELNKTITLKSGDTEAQLTLADLADFDYNEIKEVELGFRFPVGKYRWKVNSGKVKAVARKNGPSVAAAAHELECMEVYGTVTAPNSEPIDEEKLVGKKFFYTRFIITDDDIGRYKKFLSLSGFKGQGKFIEIVEQQLVDHMFVASITHTVDKNDTSKTYVNINETSAKPAPVAA
jgi:hypothetical protein